MITWKNKTQITVTFKDRTMDEKFINKKAPTVDKNIWFQTLGSQKNIDMQLENLRYQ